MKRLSLLVALMFFINFSNAQTETNKVLLESIAGEYNGASLNGLANGKGTAKGIDSYKGFFKDGLPEGKGTYTFKNGDFYKGMWKQGLKEGRGKYVFTLKGKKSTLVGFWKNNEYVGAIDPDLNYRVTSSSGIMDYKVVEVEDNTNDKSITISIKSAMMDFMPSDLEIRTSSGQFMQIGKKRVINNYICPMVCEVSYSILMGSNQRKLCRFTIEIINQGKYRITLSND